jgi:tetratricopeptide (TPR) repeat protein
MNRLARVLLVAGALSLAATTGCKKPPSPAAIHDEAGDDFVRNNQWKEAAAEYGKSLEADPKQEKVIEKKAYAHREAGDLDEADATILKMLEFKPDVAGKAEIYRNLANMYLQKADAEKAEKYFNEAVKLDPNDDVSLGWLAEIYAQRGGARDMKAAAVPEHLEKALAYYDKIIAIKPDLPGTYVNKRIVMFKYIAQEKLAKETAEAEKGNSDKAKAEAAKADVAKHQAHIDDLTKQIEELNKRFAEAQKKAKAAASAAAPPTVPAAPSP